MCKKEKYEKHRNVLVSFFAFAMLVIPNFQKLSLGTRSIFIGAFGTEIVFCARDEFGWGVFGKVMEKPLIADAALKAMADHRVSMSGYRFKMFKRM